MLGRVIPCLLFMVACSPKPKAIELAVADHCREGEAIALKATVKDAKGAPMEALVSWSVEPPTSATVENAKVRCKSEGAATIKASAGEATASHKLTVQSPLVGTWLRSGDEYAGMRVRIAPQGDGGLAGYIVGPPDETAIPGLKATGKSVSDDDAQQRLGCVAHAWAPGLKKWQSLKRLDSSRWALSDLGKEIKIGPGVCRENAAKSEYLTDYEMSLATPDRLEIRNLKVAGSPQVWARTVDVDDAALAGKRAACEQAGGDAKATYEAVLPPLVEQQKAVNAKFWAGNGSLTEFKSFERIVATLTAAQKALSDGAYKAQRAARQVPTSDEQDPNVVRAIKASEAMFNACKDISP